MSQAHFRLAVNLTSAGRRSPGSSLRGGQARAPAASDTGHPGANRQSPVAGHHLLCSPNTQHPPTTSIDKPHRRKPARSATKKDLPSALCLYPAVSFASSSHFSQFPFCCSALVAPTNVDAPLHHRVAPTPSVDFEPACSCATTIQGDQCAAGNTVGRPIFWPDQQLEPSLTADLFSRAGTHSSRSYTCAPLGDFYVCLDFARRRQ